MKDVERRAAQALRELLESVPVIELMEIDVEPRRSSNSDFPVDMVARVRVFGHNYELVCEVKGIGQPHAVRIAVMQVRNHVAHMGHDATPLVIAPYLSPEAQAICKDNGVAFLDLEGNARLAFGSVFIERVVEGRPVIERRNLKSIFKPKSAQVLRTMLRDPQRVWRVAELAKAANVSLGHVSNVKAALLSREWARSASDGLSLANPDALLDAWRSVYEPPVGKRQWFYTIMHGEALIDGMRQVLNVKGETSRAVLASFSAAQWLAPYARTGLNYFYADEEVLELLIKKLKLSPASKGENILVTMPKDSGVFQDPVEPISGVFCTSPVQTYLDLVSFGERGREAADHLRQEVLVWKK